MEELPPSYLQRMESLLGAEYPLFLDSHSAPPHAGLRVNTLKITLQDFISLAPFALRPVPWCPSGFLVLPGQQPGRHPYQQAGLFYLQEPSAMAVAETLAPRPGERVLDLAAAPGGKATHLAALMRNDGLLVANEVHPARAWDLAENLERCGVRVAAVTNESPERLTTRLRGYFDRVLLDAPCSGEGMMRKSETARRQWSDELVRGCAARQQKLLPLAAQALRPGGSLVYSTCAFSPEENEQVIASFLRAHSEFELLEIEARPGYERGRPEWSAYAGADAMPELSRAVRLWPHRLAGEGHFVALLRKAGGEEEAPDPGLHGRVGRQEYDLYRTFWTQHFTTPPHSPDELCVTGTYLYRISPEMPALDGLKVLHPGWWLGVLRKNRFEPSHALALGIPAGAVVRIANFDPEAPALLAYLRGETVRDAGPDGWTLVGVSGFPIGWAKRVQGVLKSHYPRGLRRAATPTPAAQ